MTVPAISSSVAGPAPLTVAQFQSVLPDKMKKSVSQELIDQINATLSNPEEYEQYRDNLLSYTRVMADGKFQIQQYLAAVKYVSFKLQGDTNILAYSRTFPDKMARFAAQGVVEKDIASYVTAYNKSKLVNLIMEQSLVPVHVLNQDIFQKALNVQAELMVTAKSEKVRADAANSLLTHLKPPEVKKVELDIGVKEDSSIALLRAETLRLAALQRQTILAGATTAGEIAKSKVVAADADAIDVEVKEVGA